jgi:hypothetical protein
MWYNYDMATASYLDRLLDPVADGFTPEFARHLVQLKADPKLEEEIAELRRKANEGTLSPEEGLAYREFVEAVDVISIIQSKARRYLARQPD